MFKILTQIGMASTAAVMLSACSLATSSGAKLTEQEQDVVSQLNTSKYQPATRVDRDRIETQDNLTQAAFWSREYELNPADLEAAIKLAAAVRKMGNPSKAVEITQTTRALYPENPYLNAEFAAALIASDRGEEALQTLDQTIRRAPNYARLWSLKGAALDQIESYEEARQVYSHALQIAPNDPNIMANLGLSYALAGDPKTAEVWLKRAASQPGASPAIRKNLQMVTQLQGKSYVPAGSATAMNSAPRTNPQPMPRQSQAYPQARPATTQPVQSARLSQPQNPGYGQQPQSRAPQAYRQAPQTMAAQAQQNIPPQNVPGLRGSRPGQPNAAAPQYAAPQYDAAAQPTPQQMAAIRQGQMAAAAAKPSILAQISNSLQKSPPVQMQGRAPAPYGPGAAQQLAGGLPPQPAPNVTMTYAPEQPYQQAATAPQNAPVDQRAPARRRR